MFTRKHQKIKKKKDSNDLEIFESYNQLIQVGSANIVLAKWRHSFLRERSYQGSTLVFGIFFYYFRKINSNKFSALKFLFLKLRE